MRVCAGARGGADGRGTAPRAVAPPPLVFVAAILLFLLAPLAIVVLASSLSASEFLVFPPQGLSLRWYDEVLRRSAYLGGGAGPASCLRSP